MSAWSLALQDRLTAHRLRATYDAPIGATSCLTRTAKNRPMEEILASIRRIISEDDAPAPRREPPRFMRPRTSFEPHHEPEPMMARSRMTCWN